MQTRALRFVPRSTVLAAVVGILAVVLTACTGRGGGQLPPNVAFNGAASFGFSFSCEGGDLRIQLSYTEHGTYLVVGEPLPVVGEPFSVHGTADTIDPVLESAICIGENPPPGGNELIFLGRYTTTSSAPGIPDSCRTSGLCRFEVIVRDNDRNLAPSPGDYFQITLSSATELTSELDPAAVFYTRAGLLSSGNLTVD